MKWDAKEFYQRLEKAVDALDREQADQLCGELIAHLYQTAEQYPEEEALQVLNRLQDKRFFDLMANVADALLQFKREAPPIRRQYAQALINLGKLQAALDVLQSPAGVVQEKTREYAEKQGLIGRVYKQLYVNAKNPQGQTSQQHLKDSLDAYEKARDAQVGQSSWHAINMIALLCRAERDKVLLAGASDPRRMAEKILKDVKDSVRYNEATRWDFTNAAEACLALGQADEALDWMARYVKKPSADAFHIASTLRQLEEVWQLDLTSEAGLLLLPVLRAALLDRQGGHLQFSPQELRLQSQHLTEASAGAAFEKVFGADYCVSLNWYLKGIERCRGVARLGRDSAHGLGTGFLVKGKDLCAEWQDELILLTNSHVLSDDAQVKSALRSNEARIFFEAAPDGKGAAEVYKVAEILWTSPPDELDATLVRLDQPVTGVTAYEIAAHLPLLEDNQRIYIIGHPGGGTLSFSIHDNLLLDYDQQRIHYRTPTEDGSSGSPVFNRQWELIGLHHKGGTLPKLNGKPGAYDANEGIWIQAIRQAPKGKGAARVSVATDHSTGLQKKESGVLERVSPESLSTLTTAPVRKKATLTCFAIMPSNREGRPTELVTDNRWGLVERPSGCKDATGGISVNFDEVYQYIINAAVERVTGQRAGSDFTLACVRGEDLKIAGNIPLQLIQQICTAEITVTDLTTLNPNVLLEYGIRLASKDPLNIMICHEGVKLPFDVRELRCITYTLSPTGLGKARDEIANYIEEYLRQDSTRLADKSVPSYHQHIELKTGRQAERELISVLEGAPPLLARLAEPLLQSKPDAFLRKAMFDFFNSVGDVLKKYPKGQRRAVAHYELFSRIKGLSRERLLETYCKLWELCNADDELKEEAQIYLEQIKKMEE